MVVNTQSLSIFVLAFWVLLPIPMMFFNVAGSQELIMQPNANLLSIYGNLLIFNIPNVNWFVLRFVNLIQLISLLVGYLLLRGF